MVQYRTQILGKLLHTSTVYLSEIEGSPLIGGLCQKNNKNLEYLEYLFSALSKVFLQILF